MVQSSTSFVLKLLGRYVPGLESSQASILQKFGLFRPHLDRKKLAKEAS